MVKKSLICVVVALALAASADAQNSIRVSSHPVFRIDLRGSAAVLSQDRPVARGSVVLFHRHPDGLLTSVPVEDVAAISPISPIASPAVALRTGPKDTAVQPLRPGEAVILGPTGSGATDASAAAPPTGPLSPSAGIAAALAIDQLVFPGDLPAPTGGPGTGAMANGSSLYGGTNINPTLRNNGPAMAAAATPTTVGPNGFPLTAPASTVPLISPNGFPATTTGPQSGAQPIGPNGYPTLSTPPTR